MHDQIKKIENRKSGAIDVPDFIQRASHGLSTFYILWIDPDIKKYQITVDDLVGAGFKIRPYKTILDAEAYMENRKNKKEFDKSYQLIVLVSGLEKD